MLEIMGNKDSISGPRKHCLSLLSCSPVPGLIGMILVRSLKRLSSSPEPCKEGFQQHPKAY